MISSLVLIGMLGQASTGVAVTLSFLPKGAMKVVMTNTSKKPTWLLAETCSWGYEMLNFEILDPAMHLYKVTPKRRGWDKNVPTPILVKPGNSTFRTVSLGNGTWVGLPAGISGKASVPNRNISRDSHLAGWILLGDATWVAFPASASGWKIRANLNLARDSALVGFKINGSALPGFWFGQSFSPWIAVAW
jgi:hypothetical protein